jgi:glycogen operon protein
MSPGPGAAVTADGTSFIVRARDAALVELCLFDGEHETRIPMTRQGNMHAIALKGIGAGQRYGYRAHGEWAPERGLFFDPAKLLVDPYAKCIDQRFRYDVRLGQYGAETSALVPKALVAAATGAGAVAPPLFQPGGLIYELNVRGFSIHHPDVPPAQRGTIAALAHPAIIAHFRKLRVAAIELMPIIAWIDERHLPPLNLRNAWGYNPVVPMALDPGLAPGGLEELCATVTTLHAAGIGVILDLVLNHTGESDILGPTLSLRGLDNRCYARAGDGTLINDTGTGNTLDAADGAVQALILDTLRHFTGLGVDGFRLDLATVLARGPGFDPQAPIFAAIAQDPLLGSRIMIAEPWDVGPGGYQLGNFPAPWLEWNDRYRDDVRRFWRGDDHAAAALATRMMGSRDIFHGARTRSVNFIAAHDGFTLRDLVSYAGKHNAANGEQNRDGQDENFSWNSGVEGPSSDPDIVRARDGFVRAMLSTLFASRGAIMLCAGDEFGRSQRGNNNAYAQDNDITWLNWAERDLALEDFVAALAAERADFLPQDQDRTVDEARWYDLAGNPMTSDKWEDPLLAGFEVHIPAADGFSLCIRVDRQVRECTFCRRAS